MSPRPPPHLEPYEVFRQEKEGDPMSHGGSVMAPDPELALHYARELYGRRQESERLWIVRRTDMRVLDDPDWLQPPARPLLQEARRLRDARQARRGAGEGGPGQGRLASGRGLEAKPGLQGGRWREARGSVVSLGLGPAVSTLEPRVRRGWRSSC